MLCRFSEGRGMGAVFNALFQANVHALRDPDLPVSADLLSQLLFNALGRALLSVSSRCRMLITTLTAVRCSLDPTFPRQTMQ
jgi:hypothetical protein